MKKLPDYSYALGDQQLLDLFRSGDVDAARALVDRYDGIPPIDFLPPEIPVVVLWIELLTGQRSLAQNPGETS